MYQSSNKVSEVKEEAVQPCTQEKDYPSAEDREADHRTTINNSKREASPDEGEKLATLTEDPPPFVSRRVERGDHGVEGVDEYRWATKRMVKPRGGGCPETDPCGGPSATSHSSAEDAPVFRCDFRA